VTSSSNQPSIYGQPVKFTATVSPLIGNRTPTGSVQFQLDGSNFGAPVTLTNGTATSMSISTLAAGLDQIAAVYAGNGNFAASTGTYAQNVNPAPLVVTALSQSMIYGGALPALTASYSGFVNGDTAGSLTSAPTLTTTATASSPVGSYTISASGAVDPNYTINYVPGTLSVTPATLTITAVNQAKVYGAALPVLTASYSGFVNGDTPASFTMAPTLSTTATASSPVASYAITASGAVDPNYTISYVPGSLSVTPAPLTITAVSQSMDYGTALPVLTASYSGFVNGDTVASLTTAPALSTTATASSPVGSYAIMASGAVDANYMITYVGGSLTVTQAATVTGLGQAPSTSVVGQTVYFAADVLPFLGGSAVPTGTVEFESLLSNGTVVSLGTGTLDSTGFAYFSTALLTPGSYTIMAVYEGDGNFSGSNSNQTSLAVSPAQTTISLSASATQVVSGQAINFTTSLGTVAPGAFVVPPTGTITFYDTYNGVTTQLVVLTLGGPPATTPALTQAGTHVITAVYSGDGNFDGSTSNPITVTILAPS
jgi:hypothetical protein